MKKILEYSNKSWMQGISAQVNLPVGGLWQVMNGIDPFEVGGLAQPSLIPDNVTTVGGVTLSGTPKFLHEYVDSGVSYLLVQSDTKLYQVLKNSPYTITDITSSINLHLTSGTASKQLGATIYQGCYIYVTLTTGNNVNVSALTLPGLSDVLIKNGLNNNTVDNVRFCIGADGNLYCNGGGNEIVEITNVAGTSGNTNLAQVDSGYYIREMVNDGRYLVIFADNNSETTTTRVLGGYKCKIYFWDMVQKGVTYIIPEVVYTLSDSYVIGAQMTDNGIEMITSSGVYVTNVSTFPKLIRSFPTTANSKMGIPVNPYQIVYNKGSIYWIDGTHNTFHNVYAYGNPITGQQKIFYNPYLQNVANYTFSCLLSSGNQIIAGCDQPGLFFFNTGSTRGGGQVTTIDNNTDSPHRFDFVKVTLGRKLASGESVQCVVTGEGGNSQISAETISYSSVAPHQSLIFRRTLTGSNQVDKFEDITVSINPVGVPIQRVTVYASPLDDSNVDL